MIKIIELGESKKSCSESFARPHPTLHPPALPPPLPLPSAVVNISPLVAKQKTTKQGKDAAQDKCIQKIVVHPPKTIAHIPKIYTHVPKITAHPAKIIAQVKAPKTLQAQHKSIHAKGSGREKNAVPKRGQQEKTVVVASASDGQRTTGGNSSSDKKTKESRVISTKQNRPPERVEIDEDESETTPDRIRRTRTNSPSPNVPLLRNVRFAIGESRRTLSTTSSSSTSSEDSFIDPYPYHTPTNRNATRKHSKSTPSSPNSVPPFFANMDESDSIESDISSNIDAGDTLGSVISFRDPGPATPQSYNMRGGLSIHDGKATSSVSHAIHHDHTSVHGQPPTDPSYQLIPEQEWETTSDQESAIDCSGSNQTPTPDQDINSWDWMQGQNSHDNSGFSAWLRSLVTSQHVGNSSRTTSSLKSFKQPILVYTTKRKRFAKTEKGPLLAIKKSPRSDKSHHVHIGGHLQTEVEKLEELETTQATRDLSYRSPSAVHEAEEPVHYDPGLQIFWRDV